MARNIVLAISSLAVLVVLFVAYLALMGTPSGTRRESNAFEDVPAQPAQTTQPLRVGGDLEVPGGGQVVFRLFDERSGRPTDVFSCQDWQPVTGSRNEVRVTRPELALLLPSGMVAHITADEGQIGVDRIEQSQMRPRQGALMGNVRIIIDRETAVDRAPIAERPDDLITIAIDRITFDLGTGLLRTDDLVSVISPDFEISGTGLELVWNQADNRVETLSIHRGGELTLRTSADLFGTVSEEPADTLANAAANAATTPAADSTKAPGATATERPKRTDRRPRTTYSCTLSGAVTAAQIRAGREASGLTADEAHLLFEVGSSAGRFIQARATASAPQSAPTTAEAGDRVTVRWTGPLHLQPVPSRPSTTNPRRRFEALGNPVILTRGDGSVRCGVVEYHDDERRVWLRPTADHPVEFTLGPNLSASAQTVYVDWPAHVVKLVGDVSLSARRGGAQERVSSIRAAHWAELQLAASAADAPGEGESDGASRPADDLLAFDRLESARFVGDVAVDLGPQQLAGHELTVHFRAQTGGGQSFEESLERAVARGEVQLTSGDGRLSAQELDLAFGLTSTGDLFPQHMHARGSAAIARGSARIEGQDIIAVLAPPPPAADKTGAAATGKDKNAGKDTGAAGTGAGPAAKSRQPSFVIEQLDVHGAAHLFDPDNKVSARATDISASFTGTNHLTTAVVRGTAQEPGRIHADPYLVTGEQINLDRNAQTLTVDGPGRLAFKTRRSLQGDERRDPTPVVVNCAERLRLDARGNAMEFVGQVVARSGDETLQGDKLTLLLEDVPEPATPAGQRGGPWVRLWRELRPLVRGTTAARDASSPLEWERSVPGERMRKEPRLLIAENALVRSETYADGAPPGAEPLVYADIAAPRLEVNVPARQIITTGTTTLLLIDRRGAPDAEQAQDATGVPAGLMGDGPSQMAMRCEGRMVYSLGPDGPDRQDTILFEDRVHFVRCSAREKNQGDAGAGAANGAVRDKAGAVRDKAGAPDAAAIPDIAAGTDAWEKLATRTSWLECDRLECWLAPEPRLAGAARGGALTRAPLRLRSLLASRDVYFRDEDQSKKREVWADRVEFDRAASRLHVQGPTGGEARVYVEDAKSGHVDVATAADITINLRDGTIRSSDVTGQMRRP